MIKRFRVQNFKSLVDVLFEPEPLNVLIGPNGSGKSALLQAIDFLRAFFESSVKEYLREKGWEFRDLPNLRETRKAIEWQVTAVLPPDQNGHAGGTYHYVVRLAPRRYLGITKEELSYSEDGQQTLCLLKRERGQAQVLNRKTLQLEQESSRVPASIMSTFDPSRDAAKYPEMLHFRQWVEGFRYFLMWDPKVLRSSDRGKHETLGPSGEHLAPLLAFLRRSDPDRFQKLLKRTRRLFPHVSDVSVSGAAKGWGWRTLRLHEGGDGKDVAFNSQQVSDGVLRLLAVTILRYLPNLPTLVMFEEPEDGVHPQLLGEVVQVLRELTLRKEPKRCQVIFTTHSPYVLDEFLDHPEQVFVMDRRHPQEGSSIEKLSTASQVSRIKEGFQSLGEAWFSGVIGGAAGLRSR